MLKRVQFLILTFVVSSIVWVQGVNGQGIIVPQVGAVNRAMGGAGTAAPQDAISAVYWNPAAMADMPSSQLSVSIEALFPVLETDSAIAGLAAGSTQAEPGAIPLPHFGWVHKLPDSRFTFGLGVVAAAGVKTNYPASASNPIFLPQSNRPGFPGGFGQLYTDAQFLQILPSLSYVVNDRLSIGFGPTLTLGQVVIDPFVLGAPDDADGSGAPRYPAGRGAKIHYGGGVQLSAFYKLTATSNLGLLVKSPQWMEEFNNFGQDENGLPRTLSAKFDLPMVISMGYSAQPTQRLLLAADLRYIDHKNADGFGDSGFNPDGSLAGLGFGNSYGVASGFQYLWSQRLTLRGGYTFASSPLTDQEAFVGAAAPLFYQHMFSGGGSIHLNETTDFNFAYNYSPENELNGPLLTPAGAIPGSSVDTRVSVHGASMGVSVNY
jgi:long-chain fatty acid transport protein